MFLLWLVLYGGCCRNEVRGGEGASGSSRSGCGQPCGCGGNTSRSASCCCRRRCCCSGYGAASGVCCDECYYIRQYALCGCNCDND